MGVSLFLGAGFSKWAAGLPLVWDLFDFAVKPFGPREARRLARVKTIKQAWDQSNPDGYPERFMAYAQDLPAADRDAVSWYVVRRLSDPFIWYEEHGGRIRRHVLQIDEQRKWAFPGVRAARDFISRFLSFSFLGIVTTNYDLLVEYALGTRYFHYTERDEVLHGRGAFPVSAYPKRVRLKGAIPLCKLHGSISWGTDGRRFADGRRGLSGKALIVPPVPEKAPSDQLTPIWAKARHILEQAGVLVVFGFAFNAYDTAVLSLLGRAGERLRKVIVYDPVRRCEEAERLWPRAEIEWRQPPIPAGHPMGGRAHG